MLVYKFYCCQKCVIFCVLDGFFINQAEKIIFEMLPNIFYTAVS